MKKTTLAIALFLLFYIFHSCKTPQYTPMQSVKMEYRDNYIRDSIYLYNSIYMKEKGDTLIIEHFRYLYRDKIIHDSIIYRDTIRIPYLVEGRQKTKNIRSTWENFRICYGNIALIISALLIILFIYRRR